MKQIKNVKLSLNKEAEVVVTADIVMDGPNDPDDVYFVMFNILHNPLRLVVATVGDFCGLVAEKSGASKSQAQSLLVSNPEEFMQRVLSDQQMLFGAAQEKVKVELSTQKNADLARAVVASMINKGKYHQVSNYLVAGQEPVAKHQEVPTKELMADLNQMLMIIKDWEGFDLKEFLVKQGVDPAQVDAMLEGQL